MEKTRSFTLRLYQLIKKAMYGKKKTTGEGGWGLHSNIGFKNGLQIKLIDKGLTSTNKSGILDKGWQWIMDKDNVQPYVNQL